MLKELSDGPMAQGRKQAKTMMITLRNSVNNGVLLYEQIKGIWSLGAGLMSFLWTYGALLFNIA